MWSCALLDFLGGRELRVEGDGLAGGIQCFVECGSGIGAKTDFCGGVFMKYLRRPDPQRRVRR